MKKKGLFKRIGMWFWTKSKIIDQLIKINRMMDIQMMRWISQIEKLEQHKIYLLQMPEATQEELEYVRDNLREIMSRMRWTMPEIIVVNQKVESLDLENLQKLIDHAKKLKRSVKTQ